MTFSKLWQLDQVFGKIMLFCKNKCIFLTWQFSFSFAFPKVDGSLLLLETLRKLAIIGNWYNSTAKLDFNLVAIRISHIFYNLLYRFLLCCKYLFGFCVKILNKINMKNPFKSKQQSDFFWQEGKSEAVELKLASFIFFLVVCIYFNWF